jgi:hypothetical protein
MWAHSQLFQSLPCIAFNFSTKLATPLRSGGGSCKHLLDLSVLTAEHSPSPTHPMKRSSA